MSTETKRPAGRPPLSPEFATGRVGFTAGADVIAAFEAEASRRGGKNAKSALFRDLVRALLPAGGKRYVLLSPETFAAVAALAEAAGLEPAAYLERTFGREAAS